MCTRLWDTFLDLLRRSGLLVLGGDCGVKSATGESNKAAEENWLPTEKRSCVVGDCVERLSKILDPPSVDAVASN